MRCFSPGHGAPDLKHGEGGGMERRRTYVMALASILCWLIDFCVPPAFGQATTGAIVGTVSDACGGAIADAEVSITNTTTKQGRIVKTEASGHYNENAIVAWTYDVKCRKGG